VIARVNRAIDLIVTHLPEPLPLERVADAAHCSPFHFHRLFKRVTGETLTAFVTRMRLERALHRLAHGPAGTLTEIALDAGFNSASDFSRRFRAQYGVAPSRFDLDAYRRERRGALDALSRIDRTLEPADGNTDAIDVIVRELPARTVAYVRVLDPYRADVVSAAAKRLEDWADATGRGDSTWLGYIWDDPEIVPLERCRYDVGVELCPEAAAEFRPTGEIGRFDFPAMAIAEVQVRGPIEREMEALDHLFGPWLEVAGYVPTDQPCFEACTDAPSRRGTTGSN